MEKKVSDFWDWVAQRMDELGIRSFSKLEERSGLSSGSIIKRKNEQKFPTVEMAESLCHALRVDWIELWTHAGFVDRLNKTMVNPNLSDLQSLDAEIYQATQGKNDDFKRAVLKTIQVWAALDDETRK